MNTPDMAAAPLVVDLDGTLICTDTLWEALFTLVSTRPWDLLPAFWKLREGKASFKASLLAMALPGVATLPFNSEVVAWLREQKSAGRVLVLATASNERMAQAVANHLGLFDEVLASDSQRNLKGTVKAAVLVQRYGHEGFDYIGDDRTDLAVWSEARTGIVVGGTALARAAAQVTEVTRHVPQPPRIRALLKALRPHQWTKNLLLFLPLIAGHQLDESASLLAATVAFLVFSLTASSVYLLNDLLDLPADRAHPRKCLRPFASGTLPLAWGVLLSPLLLLTAFVLSLLLPPLFTLVLGGYYLLTTAYSLGLKRKPVVDVILLAALYTARVIAGAAAVALVPSVWLLAFSMFVFFSLALAKRYTELDGLRQRGELTAAGRGWHVDDLPLVQSLGTGAGLSCILVLALYIDSTPARQLYAMPQALWLVFPLLLFWISRLWFKTHRGEMHDDPVVFALKDPVSLGTGAITACIVLLASTGLPL